MIRNEGEMFPRKAAFSNQHSAKGAQPQMNADKRRYKKMSRETRESYFDSCPFAQFAANVCLSLQISENLGRYSPG
jgi:hypothetical protein